MKTLYETARDSLIVIESIASGSTTTNSLPHLARLAREGLTSIESADRAQQGEPQALQTARNALTLLARNLVPHNPRAVAAGALEAIDAALSRAATKAAAPDDAPHFQKFDLTNYSAPVIYSNSAAPVPDTGIPAAGEVRDGMLAAAEFIEKRAANYLRDHASTEDDTGATVWHFGEAGRDYHSGLVELAQDLRDAAEQQLEASGRIAAYVPGSWFDACTVDEMQEFYLSRLPAIREAAKAHGYAIGLHGSARRDFDLMAMQWRDDASDKDTLARAIADAACGIRREGAYDWEQKPNGRFAVSIPACWPDHANPDLDKPSAGHIDLSIIERAPVSTTPTSGAVEEPRDEISDLKRQLNEATATAVRWAGMAGALSQDATLYQKLRAMHWTDKQLVVIDAADLTLGVQTYSGELLDAQIKSINVRDAQPRPQKQVVASLNRALGIGKRKPRPSPAAKQREINAGQVEVLERLLADIRKRSRQTPAWAPAYNSAATAVELVLADVKKDAAPSHPLEAKAGEKP